MEMTTKSSKLSRPSENRRGPVSDKQQHVYALSCRQLFRSRRPARRGIGLLARRASIAPTRSKAQAEATTALAEGVSRPAGIDGWRNAA